MARHEIVIDTRLRPEELRAAARSETNRRAARRMLAIANELDGYDREEAARLVGMSDQALRDAIKRFNAEGIAGLYDRSRPGRPRRLDRKAEREVRADVLAGPDIEQDGISAFTLADVRERIEKKHGATYHIKSMGRLLSRLGLSRQKSRPSHPKKDPAAAAAFKKSPAKAQSPSEKLQ